MQHSQDGSMAARQALRAAIAALRRLDAEHLRDLRAVHARFEQRWSADHHPLLARQRTDIEEIIGGAGVVCVAGGHVAVLLNRLRLFGLGRALRARPVVAWSAGAMALADRVVLFHDHPPQGAGNAELFEAGLGLLAGTVFLPHAATRLALADHDRVALLARRFAPAVAYTLDDGDCLHWRRGRLAGVHGSRRLMRSGTAPPAGAKS
jgi:peptidase E